MKTVTVGFCLTAGLILGMNVLTFAEDSVVTDIEKEEPNLEQYEGEWFEFGPEAEYKLYVPSEYENEEEYLSDEIYYLASGKNDVYASYLLGIKSNEVDGTVDDLVDYLEQCGYEEISRCEEGDDTFLKCALHFDEENEGEIMHYIENDMYVMNTDGDCYMIQFLASSKDEEAISDEAEKIGDTIFTSLAKNE